MKRLAIIIGLTTLFFLSLNQSFQAQTTAFTYQGKLIDGGVATTGQYDFTFRLFDLAVGGTQIGSAVVRGDVQVTAGIFTVNLDFGSSPFISTSGNYLEISVRPGSSNGTFTALTPLQPLTSSPYSVQTLRAASAAVADNANQLGGVSASQFVQTNDARLSNDRNPSPNSPNYIQNLPGIGQQIASFNINGGGTANIFSAATQYNIGGNRVLASNGFDSVFVGTSAGSFATGGANSFLGFQAGISNGTGFSNTLVGANTNVSANGLFNANAFGTGAIVAQSNSLVLGNNANVGIGTSAPVARLDVAASSTNSGDNTATFRAPNIGPNASHLHFGTSGDWFIRSAASAGKVILQDTGGNVGIGTASPEQKLHVVGNEILSTGANSGFKFRDRGSTSSSDDWVWYSNGNVARFFRAGVGDLLTIELNPNIFQTKYRFTGQVRVTTLHATGNANPLIISSPDQTCFAITINNVGQLGTHVVPCPL